MSCDISLGVSSESITEPPQLLNLTNHWPLPDSLPLRVACFDLCSEHVLVHSNVTHPLRHGLQHDDVTYEGRVYEGHMYSELPPNQPNLMPTKILKCPESEVALFQR